MGVRIDQFCENLRVKLTAIDGNMQALKTKIDNKAQTVENDVQAQLGAVKKRIEQDHKKVSAAQTEIKKWVEERKSATDEKVAQWKVKREKAQLQRRADEAEGYATAAAVVAMAAVDEAEQAALEAWLARRNAEEAASTKAA